MTERQLAINVSLEINQGRAYNNIALRRALDAYPQWQPHQRAFVTELVNGTLRNQIQIDHIINIYSNNPNTGKTKMKPFIRELLRTAIYQIRWMDKVPASAAVNEAVKLARANNFTPLSAFVNGILRNIVRAQESGNLKPWAEINRADSAIQYLSLRYSFPLWLAEALHNWLGAEAEEFCALSHIPPAVTVCINPLKTCRDTLAADLRALNIDCTVSSLTEACLHLKRLSSLSATELYKKGHFYVMDEGAYMAVKALSPQPGQKIIDLCAAPGGKSFACAGMMENRGQIIACDIHPHKIRLMEKSAARLGINCISLETRDAAIPNHAWSGYADALLLDAPCSGFGIIRKKPDIKYSKTMEDVHKLAALQRSLLAAAAGYLKPGGVLVYSSCTITKEENEDNINWFLDNFPFILDGDYIKLLPKEGHDGFFIARMIKNG